MSQHTAPTSAPGWRRPMAARHPDEPHRAATMLELFFDLCFVVAVAQAATGLHHAIAQNHVGSGLLGYAMVFFAIWWAWMNFTWFASAYDTDDIPYRLTALVQIAGALTMAAGIPRGMDSRDFTVMVIGYVLMRLAMVTQWLRAARSDPERRTTCLRYAGGIAAVQVCWVAWLWAPQGWGLISFAVFGLAELAVPVLSERSAPTTWHRHHIAERYGLFTLIVLGESVLAATVAVQSALDNNTALGELVTTAVGGLLTVFAMWWLYFAKPAARLLTTLRASLTWGYGHYFVFGSAAAVGAGLAVNVQFLTNEAQIGARVAAASFTVPVALFLLVVWALHLQPHHRGRLTSVLVPGAAVLILATTFTPQPVLLTGLLCAALVATAIAVAERQPASDAGH